MIPENNDCEDESHIHKNFFFIGYMVTPHDMNFYVINAMLIFSLKWYESFSKPNETNMTITNIFTQ